MGGLPLIIIFWRRQSLVDDDFLSLEISKLWSADLRPLKCVVFEKPFLNSAIGELHTTCSILDAVTPLALVAASIFPIHLTIPVPFIVLVATLIVIPGLPSKNTYSCFLIVLVRAFVHIAVLGVESLLPFTLAMFEAVLEFSNVYAPIFPLVLALTLRLAIDVDSCEDIAICKEIRTLPVLKAVQPLSFESVAIFPLMNSVASGLGLVPLTDVAVTKDSLPDTLAFFEPVCPLTFVYLAVGPCVNTFAVRLAVEEVALISVSVRIAFHATTTSGIILPLAFIDARFAILHHT